MSQYNFYMEKYRLDLYTENMLVVRGWYRDDNPDGHVLRFTLDGHELPYEREIKNGVRIRQKYLQYRSGISEEIICRIPLPEGWKNARKIAIIDCDGDKEDHLTSIPVGELKKDENRVHYYLERRWVSDNTVHIVGWVMGPEAVEITVLDKSGKPVSAKITRTYRRDVMDEYDEVVLEEENDVPVYEGNETGALEAGFQVDFPADSTDAFRVHFSCMNLENDFVSSVASIRNHRQELNALQKFMTYTKREGFKNTCRRVMRRVKRARHKNNYAAWRRKYRVTQKELDRQRQEVFENPVVFSIVIPMYRTKDIYLKELIESVLNQTYPHWELCLADGSGKDHSLEKKVAEYGHGDKRIRYTLLSQNLGIADNTNAAIAMATGDYVVLSDHDDLLTPDALYECASSIRANSDIDVIYTDEDKIDMSGKTYFEPNFKPDFNLDYLQSLNYICHMFVVKRSLLDVTGLEDAAFDGAQDYDFILRCCEQAKQIHHIPKILYHWRCHIDSTAANPESKLYAFEAGRRALEAHFKRIGVPASVENSSFYGMYHVTYHWEESPLISIIIPNKDHIDDLKKCIDSIEEKSFYRNFEFIIVENNSTDPETFAYYKELEQRPNITVAYYKGGFNFSRINNFGEQYAHGDYLLLLNNDTEICGGECLQEMLHVCMRPDVGAVGAKLCYEDDTIQHAGVVLGFGGIAGHTFIGASRYDTGYMNRILCVQDYSAVTAACLMVKRNLYKEVGGLTETFEVAFNDIDFCLKIRSLDKLVVYTPFAELHHYESKSRGYEDTPEKVRRFNGEIAKFQDRWHELLKAGDPYYNPNLSLDCSDFSLKE